MGNSIKEVLSRCLGMLLTFKKSSRSMVRGEAVAVAVVMEGEGNKEGKRREGGMGSLRGRKVSKPLAVVQGRPWSLARFWRLRAVRSMARVYAVFFFFFS